MDDQPVKQVVVVNQDAQAENTIFEYMAFFNPDGTEYEGLPSDAGDIDFTPAGTLAATDVQAAIEETSGDVTAHLADAVAAHAATAIAFTPAGTIAATTVQAAIEEVATEARVTTVVTTATAIGTAAKTTATAEPAAGTIVAVIFTNGNSAETPTLAFNGGAARVMKLGGTASAAAKLTVAATGVALFYFDGTILHQLGVYS